MIWIWVYLAIGLFYMLLEVISVYDSRKHYLFVCVALMVLMTPFWPAYILYHKTR